MGLALKFLFLRKNKFFIQNIQEFTRIVPWHEDMNNRLYSSMGISGHQCQISIIRILTLMNRKTGMNESTHHDTINKAIHHNTINSNSMNGRQFPRFVYYWTLMSNFKELNLDINEQECTRSKLHLIQWTEQLSFFKFHSISYLLKWLFAL